MALTLLHNKIRGSAEWETEWEAFAVAFAVGVAAGEG